MTTLALRNGGMPKESGVFSGLGHLKKPPWCVLPPHAMLLYVVRATAGAVLVSMVLPTSVGPVEAQKCEPLSTF